MMARWVAAPLITISELGFKRPFHLTSHSTFFFAVTLKAHSVIDNLRICQTKGSPCSSEGCIKFAEWVGPVVTMFKFEICSSMLNPMKRRGKLDKFKLYAQN